MAGPLGAWVPNVVAGSGSNDRRRIATTGGSTVERVTSPATRRRVAQVAFVILAAATCLALGWWQLQRYESSSGSGQNLGYALQWPLFAAFVVFAYRRFLQLEANPDEPPRTNGPTEIPDGVLPQRPAAVHASPAPADTDPEGRELAQYNAYLAELNATDRAAAALADIPDPTFSAHRSRRQ